jgi:hypothetical protein
MQTNPKPKASAYGILREDITPDMPRKKEKIKKWLSDFESTHYPGRPLTKQYFELRQEALKLQLI